MGLLRRRKDRRSSRAPDAGPATVECRTFTYAVGQDYQTHASPVDPKRLAVSRLRSLRPSAHRETAGGAMPCPFRCTGKRLAAQCLSLPLSPLPLFCRSCRSRSTAGNPSVETVLVTRQYANCPIGRGVADEAFTLGLCYAAGMICRRVAFLLFQGFLPPAVGEMHVKIPKTRKSD
jgi:hypothetical protein